MELFNKQFNPPSGFSSNKFTVFFTNEQFYEADYKAVMESKEILRIWSQSEWPEDTFTAADNKEDLKLHIEDNQNHSAYGYMIFTPDKSKCLGSIYINPISSIVDNYIMTDSEKNTLKKFNARIDYWTISGQEKEIIHELQNWLLEEWRIHPLFAARNGMKERLETYENINMKKFFDLKSKSSDMTLLLYSPLSYLK